MDTRKHFMNCLFSISLLSFCIIPVFQISCGSGNDKGNDICKEYVEAYCTKIYVCNHPELVDQYTDEKTCKANLNATCDEAAQQGVKFYVDQAKECINEMNNQSCEEFNNFIPDTDFYCLEDID